VGENKIILFTRCYSPFYKEDCACTYIPLLSLQRSASTVQCLSTKYTSVYLLKCGLTRFQLYRTNANKLHCLLPAHIYLTVAPCIPAFTIMYFLHFLHFSRYLYFPYCYMYVVNLHFPLSAYFSNMN